MFKKLLLLAILLIDFTLPGYAKEPAFCSDQILAQPIPNGYTWTLASRLGEILGLAEKEYGERDKRWTILGVEFTSTGQPKIWYPFGIEKKNIIIQLTEGTANDQKEMLLQLAHEVFHTLSPAGLKKTNYLEEGLATHFSLKAMRKLGVDVKLNYIVSTKYRNAYAMIEELYKLQPDANKRIQNFRRPHKLFAGLTEYQIQHIFPDITTTLARQLAQQF